MSNTCIALRKCTLNDEKYNVCNIGAQRIDRVCILVTVLCNQPEAFASDLGDDQSRCLCIVGIVLL